MTSKLNGCVGGLHQLLEVMSTHPADEHVKTVFADYGVAIFLSQCLEHELANALVYLDLIPMRREGSAVTLKGDVKWRDL